ncbi:MAG TPA: polysaccharide deacetylase family protein [Verrucomicrobiae bacterium]|jgi:peptidoglycan/xylan/chitin deacetylase (PgdA/CDA1 family)|nr:polysaccharide deacetylase family protein [Verrucomicrobiae bacterium]
MDRRVANTAPQPQYYSTFAPFREWFGHGTPVLMYHKLGPRPPGTRIKGLYAGTKLFRKQLREFTEAGFATVSLSGARQVRQTNSVVITFDDGYENVLRHGSHLLKQHGFSATQFIVADLIGRTNEWDQRNGEAVEKLMDIEQIRDWLGQGNEIGAHSSTHSFLTRIPLPAAREEITGSKRKLEDTFGIPIRHFCYPYGDYNPAVRDLVQQAGYETACSDEFGINTPQSDPFALKRLTVRHPSRSLRVLKRKLVSFFR